MMMRPLGVVCLLTCVLTLNAPLSAQISSGGSVRGHVKDEQDAVLQGVRVTAASADAPDTYAATSDDDGYYRLLDLPPGTYTLTAELDGFAKWVREGIAVRAGLNLNVAVILSVGSVSETVAVKGDTPLLESRTSVQAVNVDGDLQRGVPLTVRHGWSDFMRLTPGVTVEEAGAREAHYVNGSSNTSHVFQIDGADVMSTIQSNHFYMNLNDDAIADVQVKTSGVDASSPLGLGAVVNLATKQGTDQFHGTATIARQPQRWNGNNNPGGVVQALNFFQSGFTLGGPLAKGHAWFFGSYQYVHNQSGVPRTARELSLVRSVVPDFKPFEASERGHYFFSKGTVQLSPNHQVEALYGRDTVKSRTGQATFAGPYSGNIFGGPVYSARLLSTWTPRIVSRILASYNSKGLESLANGDLTARPVHQSTFLSGGRLTGTGVIATLDNATNPASVFPDKKVTLSADVTYFRSAWLGSHEAQAGIFLQPLLRDRTLTTYQNGGLLLEEATFRVPDNPAAGLIPFHRRIYDRTSAFTSSLDSRDFAFYVQDAWAPATRLTINVGLRVDFIRRTDTLFDVVTQDSTELGPRLGANYSITADGTDTLRATWGRIHDTLSSNAISAGSTVVGFRDVYDLDMNGSFETTFVTPGSTARASDIILDDHYHQPHVNEWTLGYRRQWAGSMTSDLSLTRRSFLNRSTGVESNAIYDGRVFRGYRDERLNDIFLVTNNIWNRPVYTSLEARVTKQTDKLQVIGSYRRVWRHLEGTWQPNDPGAILQPDAFANDRGLGDSRGSTSGSTANALSGRDMTSNNQAWRDHAATLGAVYSGPWGIVSGAYYSIKSGLWSGPVVTRIAAADPSVGPTTVLLSNGRLVSNPLATTIRFAFPTRGDGQFQTPIVQELNFRIGRETRFGSRRLGVAVELLNVANFDSDTRVVPANNQMFNPLFRAATNRQLPRSAQVSVRFAF